jgi:hypothetical protein
VFLAYCDAQAKANTHHHTSQSVMFIIVAAKKIKQILRFWNVSCALDFLLSGMVKTVRACCFFDHVGVGLF